MNNLKTVLPVIGFFFTMHAIPQGTSMAQPDTIISLQEVVVNAYQIDSRRHQVPGSISVLSGEEIVTGDGNNFASTLHAMPGIYMHSGTYATRRIVMRGVGSRTPYNTNRIKAYLNDIPITSSDGISTPEDVDLASIGRMEVIKGPASALYGSGLGGNLNLYTPVSGLKGCFSMEVFKRRKLRLQVIITEGILESVEICRTCSRTVTVKTIATCVPPYSRRVVGNIRLIHWSTH